MDSTEALKRLVGTWVTESTHVAMPGIVIHGTTVIEPLEGGPFLTIRARTDRAEIPDALWVVGHMDQDRAERDGARTADETPLCAHYFDSRGVFRVFEAAIDDATWRFWRNAPGFSQRFTGRFADDGDTIVGQSELCTDDVHWANDLAITYRRQRTA